MARYPTFEEYARNGKYAEGVKRCDELLQRSPKDVTLLITKLQLLGASQQDVSATLTQLFDIKPPISDINELVSIEAAVVDSAKNEYPQPLSAGSVVSKLWENAFKASNSHQYKTSLIEVRFDRAVTDNRLQDVQHTLIMLKAYQPKNRAVYMAHAAYTQLLSVSKNDLSSKLALGLARKAVKENFDEDKSLDCRVPGQIFAIQGAEADLKGIEERRFRDSQQVYKALKLSDPIDVALAETSLDDTDTSKMTPRQKLEAEVQREKDSFQTLISSEASAQAITKFVGDVVTTFTTATTSQDLGGRDRGVADSAFLAISGLVKLYKINDDKTHILQAAYLAERLLAYNNHVHEARLVLVYLYMHLNLGSLAMRVFDSLSVKEIQHDTVGHVLFTEVSTVHPFRTNLSGRDFYDPHEKTTRALHVYPRHEDKLAETEASILAHSQTGMVFDLQELRKKLRASLSRRVFLLEHRRIARLTGKAYGKNTNEIGPRVLANWTHIEDTRDFDAAFDYGFNVEKALHTHEDSLLLCKLAADTAWSLATKQTPLITDYENLQSAIQTTPPSPTTATTHPRTAQISLSLITILTSTPNPPREQIQTLLAHLKTLPIEPLLQIQDPLADHLPDHFIYLDILLITQQACKHIKETATHIPMEVAQVQDFCRKAASLIQMHAREQEKVVSAKEVRQRMRGVEGLQDILEEESLEGFVDRVVASAREGWEGVGKVTVS